MSINWNDAREATEAFIAGAVPPGCSLRSDGTLVVPEPAEGKVRGHIAVYGLASRIETAGGRVLKSRSAS